MVMPGWLKPLHGCRAGPEPPARAPTARPPSPQPSPQAQPRTAAEHTSAGSDRRASHRAEDGNCYAAPTPKLFIETDLFPVPSSDPQPALHSGPKMVIFQGVQNQQQEN